MLDGYMTRQTAFERGLGPLLCFQEEVGDGPAGGEGFWLIWVRVQARFDQIAWFPAGPRGHGHRGGCGHGLLHRTDVDS